MINKIEHGEKSFATMLPRTSRPPGAARGGGKLRRRHAGTDDRRQAGEALEEVARERRGSPRASTRARGVVSGFKAACRPARRGPEPSSYNRSSSSTTSLCPTCSTGPTQPALSAPLPGQAGLSVRRAQACGRWPPVHVTVGGQRLFRPIRRDQEATGLAGFFSLVVRSARTHGRALADRVARAPSSKRRAAFRREPPTHQAR